MEEEKKELTVEESFARLDEMVRQMDSDEISLEESFREVGGKIDAVEKKMKALMPDGEEEQLL